MIEAAAEMRRTLRDLYEAENTARSEEVTPMEEWASAAQFQDADPTDNDETAWPRKRMRPPWRSPTTSS